MKKMYIRPKDIEALWGQKLSNYVKDKITSYKLVYSPVSEKEQDEVFIKIVNTLLDPFLVYSGPHRLKQWEKGWGQNLTELQKERRLGAVSPKYFSKYDINRFDQKFVKGISKDYEKNMLYVILDYVFDKYLRKVDHIYEFGCGTGHNLLKAREINKEASLIGLDWSKS